MLAFPSMPFASGHIVGTWLFGKFAEKVRDVPLGHYSWFFLILGGILPDADYVVDKIFDIHLHRTYSHSFLAVLLAGIIVYLIFYFIKNKHAYRYSFALVAGMFIHIFLDSLMHPGTPWLWPWQTYFSIYGLEYMPKYGQLEIRNKLELITLIRRSVLDMALGTAFIFYLWWKKKLKF